jgi:hypothetical protein
MLEKFKLPIAGGLYYVMPDVVGARTVPAGHAEISPEDSTIWVNANDWKTTLALRHGGADNDDSVVVVQFTDHDGIKKMLLVRRPNQPGEYSILLPTESCHTIAWQTLSGDVTWPKLDSRVLPLPIEQAATVYSNEVNTDPSQPLLKALPFSPKAMNIVMRRAIGNGGVLGQFCNMLMVKMSTEGKAAATLPARLEVVIDGTVKDGLDLTPVRRWCKLEAQRMVRAGTPIPVRLLERIVKLLPESMQDDVVLAENHPLDQIVTMLETHVVRFMESRNQLAARAMPPIEVLRQGRAWIDAGNALRQAYGHVIFKAIEDHNAPNEADFDAAREASEQYLNRWPMNLRPKVLLGATAVCYLDVRTDKMSDNVVWQLGKRLETGGRGPSIGDMMLDALASIGVIGDLVNTSAGVVTAYRTNEIPNRLMPLRMNAVWFNLAIAMALNEGEMPPTRMNDIPLERRTALKKGVGKLALQSRRLKIEKRPTPKGEQYFAITEHGNVFGVLQAQDFERLGGYVEIKFGVDDGDGNMDTAVLPVDGFKTQE